MKRPTPRVLRDRARRAGGWLLHHPAALAAAGACLLAAAYGYARFIEPNWVTVSRLTVRHDRLAGALDGVRIVQLTDLHIDRLGWRERLMIHRVNALKPHVIVITGDFINRTSGWPAALDVVGRLRASLGIWAVPGNTDNLVVGAQVFDRDLTAAGVTVLRNQRGPIGETGAWFVGVDDPVGKQDRLAEALGDWNKNSRPPVILLAHAPDIMDRAVKANIPLVLAGHTHGGQLGIGWLRRLSRYATEGRGPYMAGRYRKEQTELYVNRGIGWKARPERFLAAPEITLLRFKRTGRRAAEAARPAAPATEALWLSDFETPDEHALRWHTRYAYAELTSEGAAHGARAARVTFHPRYRTRFGMDRYLMGDPARGDWSRYGSLRFELRNAEALDEQVDVGITSGDGRRYAKRVAVPASSVQTVELSLADAAASTDLGDIVRLTLSRVPRARQRTNAVFFIDAVRLEPAGVASAAAESGPPAQPGAVPAAAAGRAPETDPAAEWRRIDPLTHDPVTQIDVDVVGPDLPMSAGFVVTGGIPVARGYLKPGDPVRLTDGGGIRWPVQTRQLATWEDGSLRWLQVTTQIPPQARGQRLRLDFGPSVRAEPPPGHSVAVEDRPDAVVVSTGVLRFTVSKERFTVIESAYVDRNQDGQYADYEQLAGPGDLVVSRLGADYRSSRDTTTYRLTVEESGPLRATLKASGWFRAQDGKGYCQFTVRLQAFAGLPQLRMYHTFIYTGYPANEYYDEYKGKNLPENETIDEVTVELSTVTRGPAGVTSADERGAFTAALDRPVEFSQLVQDAYAARTAGSDAPARQGRQHAGWLLAQDAGGGIMAGVRDAWQQFPKALTADPSGAIRVKLWPAAAGPLNLETGAAAYGPDERARGSAFGLAKTHELWLGFFGVPLEPATADAIAQMWSQPWLLVADPAWVRVTDVLGPVGPPDLAGSRQAERMLDALFEWADRQPRSFNWYGMIDYGDTMTWYRKDAYDKSYEAWGWHPEGRWGWHNCEAIGSHAGALMSFLRTGELKYFRFAEAKARHVMDIDTVHYNTVEHDPRLARTITDAFSRVGSMHRHNAYHWGGRNEEATHVNVAGFLLYYYLTGYDRAWDVANEVGGFLLSNPVTYRQRPHIAPLRAIANVLWGDTLMYQATGDARYRAGAEKWAKVIMRGQREDGAWLETYNPLLGRWDGGVKTNYIAMHVLPALVAYHRMTNDPQAGDTILRGTNAMIDQEQYLPFFDALAHSYELSGNPRYRDEAAKRLQELVGYQRQDPDPVRDGMMFQKPIYDHVGPILYTAPFAIGLVGRGGGEAARAQAPEAREDAPVYRGEPLMPGGTPAGRSH